MIWSMVNKNRILPRDAVYICEIHAKHIISDSKSQGIRDKLNRRNACDYLIRVSRKSWPKNRVIHITLRKQRTLLHASKTYRFAVRILWNILKCVVMWQDTNYFNPILSNYNKVNRLNWSLKWFIAKFGFYSRFIWMKNSSTWPGKPKINISTRW